jgi:two-component system OmpR family response regulator
MSPDGFPAGVEIAAVECGSMAASPIRILLVDDRVRDITLMARTITTLSKDVEVVATAGSGAEALRVTAPFDVAVLDFRMPEMDGIELATKLRERNPNLKVIILTAFEDAREMAVGHPAVDQVVDKLALDRIGEVLDEVTGRVAAPAAKSGFFRRK